jgi:O-antigen/teichoic acid export membrane protein
VAAVSHTRRFARNAGIVVLARVWSIALWILITPIVLHHLGPERFGVWSLLFLLSGYLSTFDLGLGASVVKFTAQHAATEDWDKLRTTLAQITRLYLALAVVWILAVFVGSHWILDWLKILPQDRSEVRFAVLTSAVIFAFANLVSVGTGLLNGLQRMALANGIMTAASIPQLILLLGGLSMGFGLYAVVASTAVYWLIIGASTLIAVRRVAPRSGWPSWRGEGESGGWFRFSSAMQIVSVLHLTQQQMDKIFLTSWIGLAAVTQFELGFRVANAAQSLPVMVLIPLVPALADLHGRGDLERLRRACRRGTTLLFAGAAALAACGIPASPLAVRAWVGSAYPESGLLAQWLMAGFAVNLTTGVGTSAVRGAGRPGLEMIPVCVALLVHVTASLLLIPRFGSVGAGPAFLLGMTVWATLFSLRFARWLGDPARVLLVPPLLRSVAAFVPALLAGMWVAAHWPSQWQTGRMLLLAGAAMSAVAAGLVFSGMWWLAARPWFRAPAPAAIGESR